VACSIFFLPFYELGILGQGIGLRMRRIVLIFRQVELAEACGAHEFVSVCCCMVDEVGHGCSSENHLNGA
jgi:hypothetical protein